MRHRIVITAVGLMLFLLMACSESPTTGFQEQFIGSVPPGTRIFVPSSDGCHWAIVVECQGKWDVSRDGLLDPEYDGISEAPPLSLL